MVAAGAAAGVAIERLTVGRGMRRKARLALDSTGPYGSLRGTPGKAYADDGTELYYEVDDVEPEAVPRRRAGAGCFGAQGARPRHRRLQPRLLPQPGLLALPARRAARRGAHRALGPAQPRPLRAGRRRRSQDGVPVTIDQLGRDLKAVIDAAAPEGPLVLVGHSMGGMTVMALADQYPELIRDRVVAVALVGTSSGRLGEVNFGLPVAGVNAVRRVLPGC